MECKLRFKYLDGQFYEITGALIKGKRIYVKTLKVKRYINGKIVSSFIADPLAKIKIKSILDLRINLV